MKPSAASYLMLSMALAVTPALRAQNTAAAPAATGAAPTANAPAPFSQGELEAMVAPIALYPDALLSQMLMASTYPLEIVEAARWRKANPNLKDKAQKRMRSHNQTLDRIQFSLIQLLKI